MNLKRCLLILSLIPAGIACKKNSEADKQSPEIPAPPAVYSLSGLKVDGVSKGFSYYGVNHSPAIQLSFSVPVSTGSIRDNIRLRDAWGAAVPVVIDTSHGDSTLLITPGSSLKPAAKYQLTVSTDLLSRSNGKLSAPFSVQLITAIDSADKFPRISDAQLLDLVQRQTFRYFWDFGHPVSGLARERNTSGEIVTTGGSGFGIMAIVAAVHRKFITREEGLARIQKIAGFLKNRAQRFHGAFPHWLNGTTGAVTPFSAKDNGADLVETSFLMQGLLTARQYFDSADPAEAQLRSDINALWNGVEWDWFRRNQEDVLYWHWSPDHGWAMNMQVRGWNEALITYVLAASSPGHSIPKSVYDNGWAGGSLRNGGTFYGVTLPLGPPMGGPLFFAHYSFLGLDPRGLKDAYADYEQQNRAHALISFNHSKYNPGNFYGYSVENWGLTASDDIAGYLAHEPRNDNGVISPTAALSSFPYTPAESMAALKFFYYKLGDRLWKEYGFVDAFSLHHAWFADSFLAIDQGPVIVMIENYRSGLLWDLFMSAPEVKTGLKKLGFQSPKL